MRIDTYVILVDDDDINNYLSKVILEEFVPPENIIDFTSPHSLLQYLQQHFTQPDTKRFIFFVDINMPGMSGWELVQQLKALPFFDFGVKDFIYVLSSSVNQSDRLFAETESSIADFVEKPVKMHDLEIAFSLLNK